MARRKSRDERYRLNQPTLDIVIPVYGNPEGLKACLASIEATGLSINYRVIVVDDASPQEHVAALEAIYNTLPAQTHKVIKNSKNMGFPYTANKGAAEGFAPYILFLNSDVILQSGALSAMLRVFDMPPNKLPHNRGNLDEGLENAGAGTVAPKLVFADDTPHGTPGHVQHAGMFFRLDGVPQHAFLNWKADNERVNVMRSLQIATGACLMTRRSVWNLIVQNFRQLGDNQSNGAFNLVYGRGTYEDIEYCLSTRGVGFKVIYTPEAVASHYVGASSHSINQGFPLARNQSVFNARAGHLIRYDHIHFSLPKAAEGEKTSGIAIVEEG